MKKFKYFLIIYMFAYVSYMIQILDANCVYFYSWIPGRNKKREKLS